MKVSLFVCFCPSSPSPRLECKLPTGRAWWTLFLKLPSLHFRKLPGPTSEFLTINLLSGSGCSPCWCWTRWAQPLARPSSTATTLSGQQATQGGQEKTAILLCGSCHLPSGSHPLFPRSCCLPLILPGGWPLKTRG